MNEFPMMQALKVINAAMEEDVGSGDVTTLAVVEQGKRIRARLVAKEDLVLAGLPAFRAVFGELDPSSEIRWDERFRDGDRVAAGAVILTAEGDARTLLTGERTALNLLQRLSGIATLTSRWSEKLKGARARLADTRKTTPGLRALEKYAVRAGGGVNHRFGLYDGVLIKENHIRAAGSIAKAVGLARAKVPHTLKIEVEVTTLAELDEALAARADAVLLDNMGLDEMAEAVRRVGGRAIVEASGNMTVDRLASVAATGVDLISAGALTHSAPAVDLSLLFEIP